MFEDRLQTRTAPLEPPLSQDQAVPDQPGKQKVEIAGHLTQPWTMENDKESMENNSMKRKKKIFSNAEFQSQL